MNAPLSLLQPQSSISARVLSVLALAARETWNRSRLKKLKCIATIPLKSDELGIIGTAANLNVPLKIIPTEKIEKLDISQLGIATSEFVASQTGVLSVSTACSYLASGKGEILRDKAKYKGITIALSKEKS